MRNKNVDYGKILKACLKEDGIIVRDLQGSEDLVKRAEENRFNMFAPKSTNFRIDELFDRMAIDKHKDIVQRIMNITDPKFFIHTAGLRIHELVRMENNFIHLGEEEVLEDKFCCNYYIKNLEIPKGIKSIGWCAFSGTNLYTLSLPEGLEEIGESAFSGNKLREITLPEGLKIIDNRAFIENNLTEVRIPASVEFIGWDAFIENPLKKVFISRETDFYEDLSFPEDTEIIYID